ncbi:hypothetical protein DYB37_005002 [Aphanomyces astaci]|uniref:Uncharacterized protein n=1 Tax=Aphanomyces astaci TaxID=112090 RepID=A0A3R7A8Q2_APHAT|nr:hypothetical protein DYB37_005002 [Aphanomyces astaci]
MIVMLNKLPVDSMFLCNYLTAAQKAALAPAHPCLNVPCQLNTNSPSCTNSYCCVPGSPNCTNAAPTPCTPSGCSSFMTGTSATVEYTKVACPFGDSAFTCTHPECNNTYIYQDIVNTFAANQGCSGDQCITNYLPSVCKLGANVTNTSSANKLACTNRIVSFCASNPTDPGCGALCPYACTSQPNCPCRSDACAAVYKAPLCVRTAGACASFKASLKSELFRQRFFQPKSANLAYAKNNAGPPSGPFVWSQALTDAKASCNAIVPQLGDNLATCVQTSFAFCNANPWQTGCQNDLSTCGDGFVSWMESCDEGNLTASGGCDATCRTAPRWECYQQGTPCKRCIHATGYKVDGVNPASMCPFCYNLIKDVLTPLRLKFMAINTDDTTISDFASLSPELLTADTTPVNGILQFAHLLGRSVKDDATGVTTDYPTTVCSGSNYPVDKCRYVPLSPKNLTLDAVSIQQTSTSVVANIQKISSATTTVDTMQGFLHVAMAASTEVFSDTLSLFWAAVATGTQSKVLKNVANYCGVRQFLSNSNPMWLSNPCCNSALADFMCCMPQNVPDGAIPVLSGIQKDVVRANCPLNADSMLSFLNGAYVGLTSVQAAVNSLNALALQSDVHGTVESLQRDCQTALLNASATSCQSDNDCTACQYSQCQIDPTTLAGKCTVPWNNMIDCTVECITESMDPLLLRYLKEDWNLTGVNTSQDLANAFTRYTADMGCTGPMATSSDIGKTSSLFVCNSTCQVANMCEDKDYQWFLRDGLNNPLLDFGVAATCTGNGGRRVCSGYDATGICQTYQCTFDTIQSGCKDESQCVAQCQLPLTAGGCKVANGRWYADATGIGRCCPPDAYFYAGNQTTTAVCTYQLPNAPALAYQLRDPLCCAANNGTWFMVDDSTGSCCFGRIITIQNAGVNQLACQTAITGWDVATCVGACVTSFESSCTACQTKSALAECCGIQTSSANQTACLSKKSCNNLRLPNGNCNDSTPFCAKCTGQNCISVTQPPTCLIEVSTASDCTTAGGTWSAASKQCLAVSGSNVAASDCFVRPDLCPSVTNFTSFYTVVPLYPRRITRCLFGCYLPSLSKTTCTANTKYMWDTTHGNGSGICVGRRNTIKTLASCTTEGGVYLNATKSYFPGAFTTQAQCDQGGCIGSPSNDGWSSAQCLNTSFGSCDSQCNVCTTQTQPFAQQSLGGCFSSDATYCTSYASTSTCSNTTDPYASTLKCLWAAQPCPTRSLCLAQGKCDDFDNMRQQCLDAGWTYGDTCFAFVVSNVSSTIQTKACNNCNRTNGVCVAPVTSLTPCPVEK